MSDMEIDTPDEMVTASSPPSKEKPDSKSAKRFEVMKWNAVALWSYDLTAEECGICKNHVMDLCTCDSCNSQGIECEAAQKSGDECLAAWGVCNHSFHFHCISHWMKKKDTCPLCIQPWDYQKISH